MPQMMPMNWLILYTLFLMTFMLFNIINYYTNIPLKEMKQKKMMKYESFSWMW